MDDKKNYGYKGTVTISTEEYRDLIENNVSLREKNSALSSESWEKRRKIEGLEKQLEETQAELADLRRWMNAKEETRLAFKLFLVEEKEAQSA